jgi:hypothetical protein
VFGNKFLLKKSANPGRDKNRVYMKNSGKLVYPIKQGVQGEKLSVSVSITHLRQGNRVPLLRVFRLILSPERGVFPIGHPRSK